MDQMKICPKCGQVVKSEALKCRYCGYWFNTVTGNEAPPPNSSVPPQQPAGQQGGGFQNNQQQNQQQWQQQQQQQSQQQQWQQQQSQQQQWHGIYSLGINMLDTLSQCRNDHWLDQLAHQPEQERRKYD